MSLLPLLSLLNELGSFVFGPDGLGDSGFDVLACTSLGDLWSAARRRPTSIAAFVDWRRIEGLLSEEHQHFLADVDRTIPVVLLFDATFGQHMTAHDLGVTAVLDSPMQREELVALLHAICRDVPSGASQVVL